MAVRTRPNILWRIFVGVGIPSMVVLAVNDDAWEKFEATVGDTIPRQRVRSMVVGTGLLHAGEASLAFMSARKAGVGNPLRWWLSTLVWGFPVLARLRKAKQLAAVAAD